MAMSHPRLYEDGDGERYVLPFFALQSGKFGILHDHSLPVQYVRQPRGQFMRSLRERNVDVGRSAVA